MRVPKYKFLLDGVEAHPHYKQLNKKYSKENQQNFFIEAIEGKLTLHGADYDYVKNSSISQSFIFEIKMYDYDSNTYLSYFKSTFSKTDCKFNIDKQYLELKVENLNAYSEILEGYENEYDLIKLAPALTSVYLYKRPLVQVYIKGGNTISNFIGGTYWESDIDEAVDDEKTLINKYYFSHYKTFNEICISNASNEDVNGVYAGSNCILYNNKGYAMEAKANNANSYNLIIYKVSDITNILYYSNDIKLATDLNGNKYVQFGTNIYFEENFGPDRFMQEYVFEHHIYQRLLCDIPEIVVGETKLSTNLLPIEDISENRNNYKYAIGLNANNVYITSKVVDEPTEYGMNDYEKYFTDEFLPLSSGIERTLPICRSAWANASLWFSYSLVYLQYEEPARKKYKLKDAYFIADAIKALLKKINPDISHEATSEYSNFLYLGNNPLGLINFKLLLTQKTNILKGEYDMPAKKGEISLKSIMDMLRDCFRCYWYIEDNKFKIEHISWFKNGKNYSANENKIGLDLTSMYMNINDKPLSYAQNEIEYNKNDLPSRYEFSWADDTTDLFGDIYIDIKDKYVEKGKIESISINNFTPDVDLMLLEPSRFSNDGFALLGAINYDNQLCLPITELTLTDKNGDKYKTYIQNGYLSWAYLINYYMYDMPGYNISVNANLTYTVNDIAYTMMQKIKFPCSYDPDVYKLIKTEIGEGMINSMSINLDTRQVDVEILFKPI